MSNEIREAAAVYWTLPSKSRAGARLRFDFEGSEGWGAAKSIAVTRTLHALAALIDRTDESTLRTLATAPSDLELLIGWLLEAGWPITETDPRLLRAQLRGATDRGKLVEAAGGLLSAAQVGGLLGLSRQAVDKRRQSGRLLALPLPRRGFAYPARQFGPHDTVPGLELALEALHDHDPWMKLAFMANGNERLGGRTPFDALEAGGAGRVVEAAEEFMEQGTV
jgi:hypothetical protein